MSVLQASSRNHSRSEWWSSLLFRREIDQTQPFTAMQPHPLSILAYSDGLGMAYVTTPVVGQVGPNDPRGDGAQFIQYQYPETAPGSGVKLYVDLETFELIEGPGFRNPVTNLRFKRGDGTMVWRRWGPTHPTSANSLVLLHGGSGSWRHWIRNIEALAVDRAVWASELWYA